VQLPTPVQIFKAPTNLEIRSVGYMTMLVMDFQDESTAVMPINSDQVEQMWEELSRVLSKSYHEQLNARTLRVRNTGTRDEIYS
jgi:hypothetical protein